MRVNSYGAADVLLHRMKREGVPEAIVRDRRHELYENVRKYHERQRELAATVIVPGRLRSTLDKIRLEVQRLFAVDPDEFFGKRTQRTFARSRKTFVVAARNFTGASFNELAVYMRRPGKHSSIVYMEQNADDDDRAVAERIVDRLTAETE